MALWTPGYLATKPRLWFDASVATYSGSTLTAATNLGSDGGSFSVAGSPAKGSTLNGLDTVRLDADTKRLNVTLGTINSGAISAAAMLTNLTPTPGTRDRTIFLNGDYFGGSSTGISMFSLLAASSLGSALFASGPVSAPVAATGSDSWNSTNPHQGYYEIDNTAVAGWIDGSSLTLAFGLNGTVPTYGSQTYTVGGRSGFTQTDGDLAEVFLFDYKLASHEREKLEGYLAWKWGRQADLPGGHPYKSAAPTVSDFTIAGVATVAGVGQASAAATFTIAGVATAAGVSAAAASAFTIAGAATVAGVGSATAAAAFSAAGVATVAGVGTASASATFGINGVATVDAAGFAAGVSQATFAIGGSATASFVSPARATGGAVLGLLPRRRERKPDQRRVAREEEVPEQRQTVAEFVKETVLETERVKAQVKADAAQAELDAFNDALARILLLAA